MKIMNESAHRANGHGQTQLRNEVRNEKKQKKIDFSRFREENRNKSFRSDCDKMSVRATRPSVIT